MDTARWEQVLTRATAEVKEAVSNVASIGARAETLGRGASGDITLRADKEAEQIILSRLAQIDGLKILSEEAGEVGDKEAPLTAVVDPLDGSSNFKRGVPFYCSSIAIAEGDSLSGVRFGLVRNLVNGDVYVAGVGQGTMKNGARVKTSNVVEVASAVTGIDMSGASEVDVRRWSSLVSSVKRQVHFGANALELCFVADGTIDAFVDLRGKMRVTDVAAAWLIAREAGATITGPDGSPLDVRLGLGERFSYVAAASRDLHKGILDLTKA